MKKIPTLFKRIYEGRKIVGITSEVREGLEEVLERGVATLKWDGSCCAIFDGVFYKRYDAKNGKNPPPGAIPCCDPDPVTGHWPHWVKVDPENPADKWFVCAFQNTFSGFVKRDTTNAIPDGTFEAIGPHFQGNPHKEICDMLIRHGCDVLHVPNTFEGIRDYLQTHEIEGLVFWLDGEPKAKIKRSDFGLPWKKE